MKNLSLSLSRLFFFYFIFLNLFLAVLGLCCCVQAFSSCGERGLLSLRCTAFRCTGFSSCGTRAQQLWLVGSRAQAQKLWLTGLVILQHVGSSRTRDRTCVPCIGRWILNHCTTREAFEAVLKRGSSTSEQERNSNLMQTITMALVITGL